MDKRGPEARKNERRKLAELWKELAGRPAGELIGVVRPKGVAGLRSLGEAQWTLQIPLLAWRFDGGPVRQRELVVRKQGDERLVTRMMGRIGDYDVLRMRARLAEKSVLGSPQARLERLLGKSSDPELLAAASKLKRPVAVKHKLLGPLKLDRESGRFIGKARWRNKPMKLSLNVDRHGAPDDSIEHAGALIRAQKVWGPRVERRLIASLLPEWTSVWKLEDDKPLTGAQLIRKLKPSSIWMEPDGAFAIWYEDGGLFGGHAVVVDGKISKGVTAASIEG